MNAVTTNSVMSSTSQYIRDNLARVRERIAAAAERVGRRAEEVRLVAVTKYVGPEEIRAVVKAGCHDIGESRPQELWDRAEELADLPIRWHMVGHLQRNKVRRTLPLLSELHSGDSPRLLRALEKEAAAHDVTLPVYLEVNISGDEEKHGFDSAALRDFLPDTAGLEHLRIRGLMAMSSREGGPDQARADFAALRELRDSLAGSAPAGLSLPELSMGMSGDFETGVEEGATVVRVGRTLFEGLRQ